MEDLDAEVLLVTGAGGKRRDSGGSKGDGIDSSGEFDGVADSNADDDDDAMLDDIPGEDDDGDDGEFGLYDEDDEDDYSKPRSKRKSSRSSKSKKTTAKTKASKSRSKQSERRSSSKSKSARASDDAEDDEDFQYDYDEDGFGDFQDRERLMKLSEIARETLLAERKDARSKALLLWEKKRELKARNVGGSLQVPHSRSSRSSGRVKSSSKSDALQDLADQKRKKISNVSINVSDADSEQDRPTRHQKPEPKEEEEHKPEKELLREDEGPELRYSDLVKVEDEDRTTSPLFLRRDTVVILSQEPYFARVIEGLFVRLCVSESRNDEGSYLLCRICGVKTGRVYEAEQGKGVKTNQHLILQSGKQRRPFPMCLLSSKHPRESEFQTFKDRAASGGIEIPRREEVDRLLARSKNMIVRRKVTATDEEMKAHVANMEVIYPERVNWTRKLTESKTEMDIKKQDLADALKRGKKELAERLQGDARELEANLQEIREMESKYVLTKTKTNVEVFQSLARRNMKLNATNESLAASRRNLESNSAAGFDPFARFDTTGQSYFSISSKKRKDDPEEKPMVQSLSSNDWRKFILTWDPTSKKRKISEDPIDPAYGVPIYGLDVFLAEMPELPETKKRKESLIPPSLDAVYDMGSKGAFVPPSDAKLMSFEEWSRQRPA